jgi:chromosome segregation ATPase
MFAIDGLKLPSNASKEWSDTVSELTKKRDRLEKHVGKMLTLHLELDKDEEAKEVQKPFKKTMGDDNERRERSISRLEKKLQKLNEFLKKAGPKKGAAGQEVNTNVTDPQSALIIGPNGYIECSTNTWV